VRNHPVFLFFASLKLTVVLLALSVVLVFFGTLDQVRYGINHTQLLYFQGVVAIWQYPETWMLGKYLSWLSLPIPGGYLIGPLLVINLLAAHFRYFKPTSRNIGLMPIHGGILVLLISQFLTDVFQEEFYMWLDEGQASNYAQSFEESELVIIDKSDPEVDRVLSIPAKLLHEGAEFQHPGLPFRIQIEQFLLNSAIQQAPDAQSIPGPQADRGVGARLNLFAQPLPRNYNDNERNLSAALVTLHGTQGKLGTWLVSTVFEDQVPNQVMEVDGKTYEISMRILRRYLDFTVHLKNFTHDRYPGSDIPRNFASQVEVTDHQSGAVRDALIYMNHPLRYEGYTFYQASFAKQDTASMFQIVTNPGWLVPYIALLMVTFGLVWQFSVALKSFLMRRFGK